MFILVSNRLFKLRPRPLVLHAHSCHRNHSPFSQACEQLSPWALALKARDRKPACLAVIFWAAVRRNTVLHNLVSSARGLHLWRIGQATDNGDARELGGGCGAESSGGWAGEARAAEGKHLVGCC